MLLDETIFLGLCKWASFDHEDNPFHLYYSCSLPIYFFPCILSVTLLYPGYAKWFICQLGEIQGTVHRRLLEERQGELKTGAVLLLKQVTYLCSCPTALLTIWSLELLKIISMMLLPRWACFPLQTETTIWTWPPITFYEFTLLTERCTPPRSLQRLVTFKKQESDI